MGRGENSCTDDGPLYTIFTYLEEANKHDSLMSS
jgi:hypothetical protein